MATFIILSKNIETNEVTTITEAEAWFDALNKMGNYINTLCETTPRIKIENEKFCSIPHYIKGNRPACRCVSFGTFVWDKKNHCPIRTWNWIKKIA